MQPSGQSYARSMIVNYLRRIELKKFLVSMDLDL